MLHRYVSSRDLQKRMAYLFLLISHSQLRVSGEERALDVLKYLQEKGIKIALGSSSINARTIIKKLGIEKELDVIVDGTLIKKGKPDPKVFNEAARLLKVPNNVSLVVEDAIVGIIVARRGGFMTAFISSLPMPGDVMMYAKSLSALKDEIEKRINI